MGSSTACALQDSLDLSTIIKATRTLSGEVRTSALLQKMMTVLFESAGARQGMLIRNIDGPAGDSSQWQARRRVFGLGTACGEIRRYRPRFHRQPHGPNQRNPDFRKRVQRPRETRSSTELREEPLGDRSEKIAVRAELAKVASEKTVGEYLDRHRRRKYDRRRNRPHPRPNQGATRNLRRGQGGNRTGRPVCTVLRIGLLARRADVQGDRTFSPVH